MSGMWSRDLPAGFSVIEKKLSQAKTKFVQQFETKEPRMREIAKELRRISEQVKKVQRRSDKGREVGVKAGGIGLVVGLGLGLLAAPLTGGASLAAAAVVVGGGGAIGAAGGTGVILAANLDKMWTEKDCLTAVQTLSKEFQEIVEPLKGTLEEIKQACEALEVKAAEYQSGKALVNMEEYKDIFKRVSELKVRSIEALLVATISTRAIESLLTLIVNVLRLTPTPEEDKQLRDAIVQSADQSQKVVDEFEKMQKHI